MIYVIVYKPSHYGLVFIGDNLLGLRPRVYHLSHEAWAGLCALYIVTYCLLYFSSLDILSKTYVEIFP